MNVWKNILEKIIRCGNLLRAFHQGWGRGVKSGDNSRRRFNGGNTTGRIVLIPPKLNSNKDKKYLSFFLTPNGNLAGNILLQAY